MTHKSLIFSPMITRLLLGIALAAQAPVQGQGPPPKLTAFLRQRIGLDSVQLAAIERGETVVKELKTSNGRDVALFGIAVVDMSRQAFVARAANFSSSLSAPTRRFGIFHDPAAAADVAAATMPADDLDEMQKCRPGDCKIKMPAADMQRLQSEVDWSSPNAQAQVSAYLRQRLVEYAGDYRARGDSALVVYDDKGAVHASDAFGALLAQSPYIYEEVSSLGQYLAGYPRASLDGAREVLYWKQDSLPGMRPLLSVDHLVLYTPPETPGATLIADKQLYASHYFEAAFYITAVVERSGSSAYLVVLRRYRFDKLPGFVVRGKVVGKMRDQLRSELDRQQEISKP